IDSNKTAKDLWDALARHMLSSEYDEQDMKAAVLSKEKVVVSSDSEGSEAEDFSELKKITALLEKAFNRRKNIDDVDKTMDEINDQAENMKQI
nr:vacuolar protein sorting-associated protein 32 homolog 2-like [Tanacetum cinerariifolium]